LYTFIVFCVFITLLYSIQVYKYNKLWLATPEIFTKKDTPSKLQISIIVSARNEEKNIEKCIKSLLNQNYNKSNYEILVFDDFSEDKTYDIVSKFKEVKIFKLQDVLEEKFKNLANKKRAISLGIKEAKNNTIITVDADCFYKEDWLLSFAQFYEKTNAKMISAPIDFLSENTFFSNFLELDLISLIGITCATIKNNKPTMVNGANLLFTKNIFIELNGFDGNEDIASGDDVFLMQKIHKKYNNAIIFLKNKDSFAYTNAPNNFSEFINQRIRWTSKSVRFADSYIKINLFINYFFYFSIFLNFIVLSFFSKKFIIIGLFMFGFKLFFDNIFFKNLLSFYKKEKLNKNFIFIELVHVIYIFLLGIFSLFGKYSWKNRKM